jgi:chemotaxis protein CheZ
MVNRSSLHAHCDEPDVKRAHLEWAHHGARKKMPVQRKIFRIEQTTPVKATVGMLDAAGISPAERNEIIAELKALHDLVERRSTKPSTEIETCSADELRRLKSDTDAIHLALTRTKQEVAALHASAFGPAPARVTRELDAVVESAERATQQILGAAEEIEDAANTLSASLKRDQEKSLALDIQDNVLRIFEACNFQDLTGQRIAKVLTTLTFVEERIAHMIEIWGGIEAFKSYAVAAEAQLDRSGLLHGPKLDDDDGHASQDDVDAMFATG